MGRPISYQELVNHVGVDFLKKRIPALIVNTAKRAWAIARLPSGCGLAPVARLELIQLV